MAHYNSIQKRFESFETHNKTLFDCFLNQRRMKNLSSAEGRRVKLTFIFQIPHENPLPHFKFIRYRICGELFFAAESVTNMCFLLHESAELGSGHSANSFANFANSATVKFELR